MKSKFFKLAQFLVFTLLAVWLVYFVFKDIDLTYLWQSITEVHFFWVFASIFFGFMAYIIRAIRWNLLIEPLGYFPSTYNSFLAVVFGYFANMGFPRIGEIARCSVLSKKENIPFNNLIGTVIAERIIDLIVLIMLVVFTFFFKISLFGNFINSYIIAPFKSNFSYNKLLVLGIILSVIFVGIFILFKKSKNPLTLKILNFVNGIRDGLKSIIGLKKRKLFFMYTFLLWFSYWLMTWLICFSIPQTSHLHAIDGLFLLVVGGIGMVVPVQNGIGVFHFIVGHAIAMYGFDFKKVGILYATVSHESQTIFIILLGIVVSILIFVKKKKSNENLQFNSK